MGYPTSRLRLSCAVNEQAKSPLKEKHHEIQRLICAVSQYGTLWVTANRWEMGADGIEPPTFAL
jgi:hypothetical protein